MYSRIVSLYHPIGIWNDLTGEAEMAKDQIVDIGMLLALNPEYVDALSRGERWAREHMRICESLNRGEPEGFRRPFDGKPRKWCGAACDSDEGCVTCTLPENPEVARHNREWKKRPADPMELAKRGIITIVGEINIEMSQAVREMLDIAQQNAVNDLIIIIESPGGSSLWTFDIYDMIRAASVQRRVGVVKHRAFSGAAVILQACDWRVAFADAQLLIHQTGWNMGRISLDELRDSKLVQSMIDTAEPFAKRGLEIFKERTKRTEQELTHVFKKEKYMTAQEALEFGLIDEIKPS